MLVDEMICDQAQTLINALEIHVETQSYCPTCELLDCIELLG